MSDYSMKELREWNDKIELVARNAGLDFFDQEFEIVTYDDMMSLEAYSGMPSHYPHWSFGKACDRLRTFNKYNLAGLPYEMVINSNPSIAYLMKDNTLLLQILTIAHVYAHNDFFKNNRLFKEGTQASQTVEMFKNHADRIREYISDPSIGYGGVEKFLNAAHALRFQLCRNPGTTRLKEEEKRKKLIDKYTKQNEQNPLLNPVIRSLGLPEEIRKIPPEPEDDLLFFLCTYGQLEEWQRDILDIVRCENAYFVPQIETKIMNEGWASYWHYKLLNSLGLSQSLYIEFLKRHNQVVRPVEGRINPYFLGFRMFQDIEKRYKEDTNKIFEIRSVERDESFIRKYLTYELCGELNLFEYVKVGAELYVSEVSDEQGWKKIRDTLAASCGMGMIPAIQVLELVKKDNSLLLEHCFDGRELELSYAYETLKYMVDIWGGKVLLQTKVDNKKKIICCDENKKITLLNG